MTVYQGNALLAGAGAAAANATGPFSFAFASLRGNTTTKAAATVRMAAAPWAMGGAGKVAAGNGGFAQIRMVGAAFAGQGTVDSYRFSDPNFASYDPIVDGATMQRRSNLTGASWTGAADPFD